MSLLRKSICLLRGHRSTQVPAVFYRSWDGFQEIGSLHCKRCGAMLMEIIYELDPYYVERKLAEIYISSPRMNCIITGRDQPR